MFKLCYVIVGFLALLESSYSQEAQRSFTSRVDVLLESYFEKGKLNGDILIAVDGQEIYHRAWGYVNMVTEEELDSMSVFGLASVSKIFTSSALHLLEQRGEISLQSSIRVFFPELPAVYEPVTIYHMLSHTSGIPRNPGSWQNLVGRTNQDILEFLMAQKALEFVPGSAYQYCNYAFVLLAMLVERVSNLSFADFLEKELFQKAGMKHSFAIRWEQEENYYRERERLGLVHSYVNGKRADWPLYTYGPGGVCATAKDLLRWDRAVFSQRIFTQEQLERILRPVQVRGEDQHYGLGWGVLDAGGERIVGHTGGMFGFRILYEHQIQSGVTLIIMGNIGDDMPLMEIRSELLRVLIESIRG